MVSKTTDQRFWDAVLRLLRALRDAYGNAAAQDGEPPGRIGEAAVPVLLRILADADEPLRAESAWILATLRELILVGGSATAVPGLLENLKDHNTGVRRAAIRSLGWLGDAAAAAPLLEVLTTDPDVAVRREVAEALGKIGHASAVQGLLKAVDDPQESVRHAVVWALGRIGDRAAVPALIGRLRDAQRDVRRAAARSLGWIGDAAAVPGLLDTLRDEASGVRRDAARALGKIGDASAVPALVAALHDPRPIVRIAVADALGAIRDTGCAPMLLDLLSDEDRSVRRAAARALGMIGDPRAVTALLDAMHSAQSVGDDADTYIYGTVLYDALTSSLPVEAYEVGAPNARYIDPVTTTSRPVESLLRDSRPAKIERPVTVEEVVERVEALIEGKDEPSTPPSSSTKPPEDKPASVPAPSSVVGAPAMLLTAAGLSLPIKEAITIIGRGTPDDLEPPDLDLRQFGIEQARTVSHRHCRILTSGDQYYLEDLDSRNGTFINRERLKPERLYRLHSGDSVLIGRVLFEFRVGATS